MTEEPASWFYGLMAERVAEFTPNPRQVPFFQREIERFGRPEFYAYLTSFWETEKRNLHQLGGNIHDGP
jgi:hypothetical protein